MPSAPQNLAEAFAKGAWERAQIPKYLWHYTDAAGLIGIAKSQSLWCAEYRHLNDSEEIAVFANHAQAHLRTELESRWSKEDVDVIVTASNLYTTWNVFICSFCVDEDRNEHWYQYAKRAGYALGFDTRGLRSIAIPQGYSLAPVIYGEKSALDIATALVKDSIPTWKSFNSPLAEHDRKILANFFCRLILSFAPFFKPASFSRENEWRLVRVSDMASSADTRYRPSKAFGVLAYQEFKLKTDSSAHDTETLIPRLVIGPGNSTKSWIRAGNPYELLSRSGFETLVSESKSSLRILE